MAEAAAAIEQNATVRIVSAQAGKKARAAARKAVWDRLTAIARTARRATAGEPAARDVFRLPARSSDHTLLATARAFVREGEAASARWVPLGLSETSIAELSAAADAFQQAIDGRRQGKSGVVAAREAMARAFDRGFDAVRELDVIVANTLEPNSPLVAAWKRERRVQPAARVAAEDAGPTAPPAPGLTDAATASGSTAPEGDVTGGDALRRAS